MESEDGEATERAEAGVGGGVAVRRRPAPKSTRWFATGAVGLLLLVLGVWKPAWSGVPAGVVLGLVCAVAGGVLVVVGFTVGWREREAERRRGSLEDLPGVELFDPRHASGGPPEDSDEPPR
jgi:hypothetical protein